MSAVAAYAESGGQGMGDIPPAFSPRPAAGCRAFSAPIGDAGPARLSSALAEGEDHFELGTAQSGGPFVAEQGGFTGKLLKSRRSPADRPAPCRTDRRGGMDVGQTIRMAHLMAGVCHSQMAGLRLRINIGNGCKAWSSSLAAWRSVVSIHRIVRRTPRSAYGGQLPQGHALDRQLRIRFAALHHQLAQPAGRPASRVRGYSRSSLIDKGDADDRLHVAGSDLPCGPGIGLPSDRD